MMDAKNTQPISFTEDYLITCCIFRLLPEEVLTNFISLISYDGFMVGGEDEIADAANRIVAAYLQPRTGTYLIHEKYKFTHSRCREVLEAILDDPNLTMDARTAQLAVAENWCYGLMGEGKLITNRLLLSDGRQILLPVSFMLLCFVRGIDGVALIQFFISQVSWAKYVAIKKSERTDYNPFMHLITTMHNRNFRSSAALQEAGYFDLLTKMHQFHKRWRNEPDDNKRLPQFESFLKKMCQVLKNIPIDAALASVYIKND